jgi:lipopolysaccharide/colanic/teichoic acid biosynthesis glycosyltransferase
MTREHSQEPHCFEVLPAPRSFSYGLVGAPLLACLLGFSLAVWLYEGIASGVFFAPWPAEWIHQDLVSSVTAWVAVAFTADPADDGIRLWIDRLFSIIGLNLIVQYGLAYLLHIPAVAWPVVVAGSVFAVAWIGLFQKHLLRALPAAPGGVMLLGYDAVAESILPALGSRVGVLGCRPERASLPYFGSLNRFEDVLVSEKPVRIVVNDPCWPSTISPRRLLALRYAGVIIEDAPTLFENIQKRVCWQRIDPLDLLLSPRLNINRSAMALQAIYTNVIGLTLLILFSPLLVLVAVLMALTTTAAPLESIECLGFQRIPFRLLRFRTYHRSGKPVWFGTLLKALHLVNLPQLINVVRGEMTLFGPPPARRAFAERISQLIPVYAQRFRVKPGIMGWSQANLPAALPADESLRLEYDLYYIREESPSLDLDILLRTFLRTPVPGARNTTVAGTATLPDPQRDVAGREP